MGWGLIECKSYHFHHHTMPRARISINLHHAWETIHQNFCARHHVAIPKNALTLITIPCFSNLTNLTYVIWGWEQKHSRFCCNFSWIRIRGVFWDGPRTLESHEICKSKSKSKFGLVEKSAKPIEPYLICQKPLMLYYVKRCRTQGLIALHKLLSADGKPNKRLDSHC